MKTSNLIIIVMLTSFCLQVSTTYAKIWRVNNRSNIPADFTTAQAAHDGATAGDTIFLEPSPYTYGNIILTKKLIMIGTGYFLDQNPETQWYQTWPVKIGTVLFSNTPSSTCEYSQLMGVTCTGSLTVNVSNITIRRNYLTGITYLTEATDAISNIYFNENFCTQSFYMTGQVHDVAIQNNIFNYTASQTFFYISGTSANNGLFINNIILGLPDLYLWDGSYFYDYLSIDNFIIQNNILSAGIFVINNNTYSYNLANNTAFGDQNGNQQNVDMSTVFLYTGSSDGQFQLKEGSPAIGAGAGGTDCGVFGGLYPYVLSGLPPVPAIYSFIVGNNSSQFIINAKVKSHN
jgi:hypothetical protein